MKKERLPLAELLYNPPKYPHESESKSIRIEQAKLSVKFTWISPSETRWRNKKQPNLHQKLSNKKSQQFQLQMRYFSKLPQRSPQIFGLNLLEIVLPRPLRNSPIWSHFISRSTHKFKHSATKEMLS